MTTTNVSSSNDPYQLMVAVVFEIGADEVEGQQNILM